MIHIFDKVYLTYAEMTVGPSAIERMAETYIQVIDKNLIHIDHHHYNKNRIAYTKSIQELLTQFESDYSFFEYINNELTNSSTNKIIIYADEKSFNEFLIRWWRGIFPNLTIKSLYSLYSSYADSEILQISEFSNYINIAADSANIPFKYFSKIYWEKSIQEIEGLYNLYPPFEVPDSVLIKSSLEFQIFNFKMFPSHDHSRLLLLIDTLYKKTFMAEICGAKRMIERCLPFLISEIEEHKKIYTLAPKRMVEIIETSSSLKFILDDKIKESKDSFDYLTSNYNLIEFSNNIIELDIILNKKLNISRESLFQDNPCLAYFITNSRHPELELLINSEYNGTSVHNILKKMIQTNKVNPYLLPGFYNLKQSLLEDDQSFCTEFTLGVYNE